MQIVISYILIFFMMISCFFGGFAAAPSDLQSADGEFSYELSQEDMLCLESVVASETAWLASIQLDNGAIPMYATQNGEATVNPYFADFAAMALLDKEAMYKDNVISYMDWHFDHLNDSASDYNGVDGTIYDYTVTVSDGKVVNEEITLKDGKPSYDSTDSYAATFLMLLEKYYSVTGDSEYILLHKDEIVRICEAMLSTLHMGLTFAKPDYEVKYLMDNSEVYEGLVSAVSLFDNVLGEDDALKTVSLKCTYALQWMSQKIESNLWNANAGHYYSGIFKNGDPISEFIWDEFYPDATSQLFPIIHGVIPSDTVRAHELYKNFCESYDWQSLAIPSDFCWGAMVYSAAVMGDYESVMTYMNSYLCFSEGHSYPLYNADSARVSMAAAMVLDNFAV